MVDVTAYADADRFISHAVYADSPQALSEIGSQITAPRPEDANTLSVIDATKYQDPDAAPAQPAAPVEQRPAQ